MISKGVQKERWHFSVLTFLKLWRIVPLTDYVLNYVVSIKILNLNIVFGSILGFFLFVSPVSAYIDPGTASMVWQLMLATLLGIAYAVRLRWTKIKDAFRKRFNKSE